MQWEKCQLQSIWLCFKSWFCHYLAALALRNDLTPLSLKFLLYKIYVTLRISVKVVPVVIIWCPCSSVHLGAFPGYRVWDGAYLLTLDWNHRGAGVRVKRKWGRKGGKANTGEVLSIWPWPQTTLRAAGPCRTLPESPSGVTEPQHSLFRNKTAVYELDSSHLLLLIDQTCPMKL